MRWFRGSRWRFLGAAVLLGGLAVSGCGKGKSAQSYFNLGAERYGEEDFEGAIAAYQQGLELEPRSAVGHNLLGMAYRMQYNTVRSAEWKEKEIAEFRTAVECDSTYWPAYINLGASLYYLGRKEEAAPWFETALVLHPENPERLQLEGFIEEGKAEAAKREGGP